MKRRSWLVLIAVVVIAALGTGKISGLSQSDATPVPVGTPIPGAVATAFLPAPESIGDGWQLVDGGVPGADPAVFASTASAIYVGPAGARIHVQVYQNQQGRVALNRSWTDVGSVFDDYRYALFGFSYGREEALAQEPLAVGCVDARRWDGNDRFFEQPSAIAMCAIDPDITAFIIVTGAVEGQVGYLAADLVASLAYAAGTGSGDQG